MLGIGAFAHPFQGCLLIDTDTELIPEGLGNALMATAIRSSVGLPEPYRRLSMTKRKKFPTEAQFRILEAASRRSGLLAMPLPIGIHGAAARTVVGKLVALGYLKEVPADPVKKPLWRETLEQGALTLVATKAAMDAVGIVPVVRRSASRVVSRTARPKRRKAKVQICDPPVKIISLRPGTKQATLLKLLERGEGANLAEICDATGWQSHSVRGAISGTIGKKLGLQVTTSNEPERGRVYRIAE